MKFKKLRLNRETLVQLDALDLRKVGGATLIATDCNNCSAVCSVKCTTTGGTNYTCQFTCASCLQGTCGC